MGAGAGVLLILAFVIWTARQMTKPRAVHGEVDQSPAPPTLDDKKETTAAAAVAELPGDPTKPLAEMESAGTSIPDLQERPWSR